MIIVAALGRNDGIASGARLQWDALRGLGVDAELLDATPALRNPLFRIPAPSRFGLCLPFRRPADRQPDQQRPAACGRRLPHRLLGLGIARSAARLVGMRPQRRRDLDAEHLLLSQSRPIRQPPGRGRAAPYPPSPCATAMRNAPFTVLAMADSRSSWSRKNPEGALRAFRTAFGTSPAARLVFKLGGRAEELCAFEDVPRRSARRRQCRDRPWPSRQHDTCSALPQRRRAAVAASRRRLWPADERSDGARPPGRRDWLVGKSRFHGCHG